MTTVLRGTLAIALGAPSVLARVAFPGALRALAALAETADTTKAALSVKDAQELLALQQAMLQPTAEKAAVSATRPVVSRRFDGPRIGSTT